MMDNDKAIAMSIFWSDRTAKNGKMTIDDSKKWSDMFSSFKKMIIDSSEYQSGSISLADFKFELYTSKQNIYRIILDYDYCIQDLRKKLNFKPESFEEFEMLLALKGY